MLEHNDLTSDVQDHRIEWVNDDREQWGHSILQRHYPRSILLTDAWKPDKTDDRPPMHSPPRI